MRTKEWLKEQRIKYSLTQGQLANKIGVSKSTIEDIEQGKLLGTVNTWDKIEDFFLGDEESMQVSSESEDIIEELKQDIDEYGEDYKCALIYKIIYNSYIVFIDYLFLPINSKKDLESDEFFIETTLKYAFEVFERQNRIL